MCVQTGWQITSNSYSVVLCLMAYCPFHSVPYWWADAATVQKRRWRDVITIVIVLHDREASVSSPRSAHGCRYRWMERIPTTSAMPIWSAKEKSRMYTEHIKITVFTVGKWETIIIYVANLHFNTRILI